MSLQHDIIETTRGYLLLYEENSPKALCSRNGGDLTAHPWQSEVVGGLCRFRSRFCSVLSLLNGINSWNESPSQRAKGKGTGKGFTVSSWHLNFEVFSCVRLHLDVTDYEFNIVLDFMLF